MTVKQLRAALARLPKGLDDVEVSLGNEYQAHFLTASVENRRVDITPRLIDAGPIVIQGTPGNPEKFRELWMDS